MFDLCAIGDALIDFIPAPQYTSEAPVYQCEVGGDGGESADGRK